MASKGSIRTAIALGVILGTGCWATEALAGTAPMRSGQMAGSFGLLDNDGDGFVNREEAMVADHAAFASADRDADGRLDRTEYYGLLAALADELQRDGSSDPFTLHSMAIGGRGPWLGPLSRTLE